mmetsp:Transcript_11980/g.16272  ORF Transcript_11980/g.16272 Transcript_11980/m.16272 type:complete len:237 (-) Transcript_11980:1190-1900(-)
MRHAHLVHCSRRQLLVRLQSLRSRGTLQLKRVLRRGCQAKLFEGVGHLQGQRLRRRCLEPSISTCLLIIVSPHSRLKVGSAAGDLRLPRQSLPRRNLLLLGLHSNECWSTLLLYVCSSSAIQLLKLKLATLGQIVGRSVQNGVLTSSLGSFLIASDFFHQLARRDEARPWYAPFALTLRTQSCSSVGSAQLSYLFLRLHCRFLSSRWLKDILKRSFAACSVYLLVSSAGLSLLHAD